MRLNSLVQFSAAALAVIASAAVGSPAAQAAPPDFPNIDAFDAVTWNDYLVGGDDAAGVHLEFRTRTGLTCFLNIDAYSFECWGALHGAPAGANHVRGNIVNYQPAPELENEPNLLPDRTKISWRGATCGVDGPVTACYQVDRGFVLDDKQTKVFPTPEPVNGQPVSPDVPDVGSAPTTAPASPSAPKPTA